MDTGSHAKSNNTSNSGTSLIVRVLIAIFLVVCALVAIAVCYMLLQTTSSDVDQCRLSVKNCSKTDSESDDLFVDDSDVILDNVTFLLNRSVNVRSIVIQNYAKLMFGDSGAAVTVRTGSILIQSHGGLFIGTETTPHLSPVDVVLVGRSDDRDVRHPIFGRKFIGVMTSGTLQIHGARKRSWTFLNKTLFPGDSGVVELGDDVSTWEAGDQIIITSSDSDMQHAEQFTLLHCPSCTRNQVNFTGTVRYHHIGQLSDDGVDTRAEVALLSRNVRIHGEMEPSCYDGDHLCQYFNYDTFGGHIQVVQGAGAVRIEGVELYHMGQQQELARYPVHWHLTGDVRGDYVRQLSIHDCFSRCVTVHAAVGLLVEDVVGYRTLGHCFFLEDGNEQGNVFIRNLGLITQYGSLIPSDRSRVMCRHLALSSARFNYTPVASDECMHVSTFWISHPNNSFVNNSAAGSEGIGFFVALYRQPTGPSAGSLPTFHGERTSLKKFDGNRAHSNRRIGFLLDGGVKTTSPTAEDPREFLSVIDEARYQPHVGRNLTLNRAPVFINDFTAYNNQIGLFVRGGDVWISRASSAGLPYDPGSHQKLVNSTLVCHASADRTLLSFHQRRRPRRCVGIVVGDGPVLIASNSFYKYSTVGSSAVFLRRGHGSLLSVAVNNQFHHSKNRFEVGSSDVNSTDPTHILYDLDGSVTGMAQSYVVPADNPLLNNAHCRLVFPSKTRSRDLVVCSGEIYGRLHINAFRGRTDADLLMTDIVLNRTLVLHGSKVSNTRHQYRTSEQHYWPIVIANRTYRLSWVDRQASPDMIEFSIFHLPQYQFLTLELKYSTVQTLAVTQHVWNEQKDEIVDVQPVQPVTSRPELDLSSSTSAYYFDNTTGLLQVKLLSGWGTSTADKSFNYCPPDGCKTVQITAIY